MAWLRGENEIAWFSCAARGTVSFCANVNKDGKQQDSRGLLGFWKHGHVDAPPWGCAHCRFGKGQLSAVSDHQSRLHWGKSLSQSPETSKRTRLACFWLRPLSVC